MHKLAYVALILALAGCGGAAEPETPPAPEPPPESHPLALPVTAPMRARDRLLQDLDQQKAEARDREAAFDSVIGGQKR